MIKRIWIIFFGLINFYSQAQFSYQFDQSIPVNIPGKTLDFPWAGGLNAPQFNQLDMNEDALKILLSSTGLRTNFLLLSAMDKNTVLSRSMPLFSLKELISGC